MNPHKTMERIRRSLLLIEHVARDGTERILGAGSLVARSGPFMLGFTASHILENLVELERPGAHAPSTLFKPDPDQVNIRDALDNHRFQVLFACPNNRISTAYIIQMIATPTLRDINLNHMPNTDLGVFVCMATNEQDLAYTLPLPICTDIPPPGMQVMVAGPRNTEMKQGLLDGQLIAMHGPISRHYRLYGQIHGPCFEVPFPIDNQTSGSPVIGALDNDYESNPTLCGVICVSDLPPGRHPFDGKPGEWHSHASHLFPLMALSVFWPYDGPNPVKETPIEELARRGVIQNRSVHPLKSIVRPIEGTGRNDVWVVSEQWENICPRGTG